MFHSASESTSRAYSAAPAVPYYTRQLVYGSGKCRKRGLTVCLHWRKVPRTFALFHCGPFSMVDHFMTAGVPSFPQITEVRNVGADRDGNSVSGSKASSVHAFPARTNRNPRRGTRMMEVAASETKVRRVASRWIWHRVP